MPATAAQVRQVRKWRREEYLTPQLSAIIRYFRGEKCGKEELEILRAYLPDGVVDDEIRSL